MGMKKFISYDLGTGGVKARLFDEQLGVLANSFIEYSSTVPISINLFNGSSLLSKGLKDMILSSKVNQSLLYGIFNNSNALLSTFPMGAFFLSLYGVLQDCVIISSRSIPVMPI